MDPLRPRITHVAVRFRGTIYSLPAPNRHHHVIRKIVEETGVSYVDSHDEDQGFLDESGRYLTRKKALVSALLNDQVKDPANVRCKQLMSEDVW